MASKRPTTIAKYIRAAPCEGQPHLRRLYAILKSIAPQAAEAIKWGTLQIPTTSPCQRIWFARSLSTVSGMCVNVKTTLSGNSIPAGMDGLFGLVNVGT